MNHLICGSGFLPSFSHSKLTVLTVVLLAAFGVGLPQIYADNFGISYDNTCKTMIKNNVTSDCPTYEDIITLYPDTSIKGVSGEFGYRDGIYQRLPTKFINSFEYYRHWDRPILFVDPPVETATRIKLIEIKANLDQYLLRGETKSYNPTDHTLTMGIGRYIDSCRLAYVDAAQWIFLVGDTLNHMNNGCSADSTQFNSTVITKLGKVQHDITTSYKYKLEQFQKAAIEQCGKKVCLYEPVQPTPP